MFNPIYFGRTFFVSYTTGDQDLVDTTTFEWYDVTSTTFPGCPSFSYSKSIDDPASNVTIFGNFIHVASSTIPYLGRDGLDAYAMTIVLILLV